MISVICSLSIFNYTLTSMMLLIDTNALETRSRVYEEITHLT